MTTPKQERAAKQNIKKAQVKWKSMTHRQHALAQPEGRDRARPGSTGEGEYYHIEVRPKGQFTSFRNHDVGEPGGLQRVAGRRSSGSWADQAWLIAKDKAHLEGTTLVADDQDAQEILEMIGPVEHVKGDIFKGHPRKNVPEKDKPTPAQRKAQAANIKKAQAARRKKET